MMSIEAFARSATGFAPAVPSPLPLALSRVIGRIAVGDIQRRFDTSTSPTGGTWVPLIRPRITGGDKPLLDTGQLRASITDEVTASGAKVGTVPPAAALHNFGGVVRPTNAQSLAIPVTKEAQRAGSPRRFPRPLFVLKKREDPRGGALAERVTRRGKSEVVVHYLLRKSVKVPAREFWGLSSEAVNAIGSATVEFLVSGFGGRP